MPQTWLATLRAVAAGDAAWRPPSDVAADLAEDPDVTADRLVDLHLAGWVDCWDLPGALVVTLSPRGASALGLELAEFGPAEVPRWVRPDDWRPAARERRALKSPDVPGPLRRPEFQEPAPTRPARPRRRERRCSC